MELQERSLLIRQEIGDKQGVAICLHQLGILHQLQGEYKRALELQERSLLILQEIGDKRGVAICLHQLGVLHHDQGEYGQARARYKESLAIKEELGDRAGVASSLAQMGLLFEQEDEAAQAVVMLAQALVLFEQLGSPAREQARRDLARLREKMGAEAFEAALEAAHLPPPPEGGDSAPEGGMTLEQAVDMVVNNTIAVLTQVPEKKGEWRGALGQLEAQVKAQELDAFAAFLGLLRQLVEGASPAGLAPQVPPEFREAWEAVVQGTSAGAAGR
jgi:hypothetical protein